MTKKFAKCLKTCTFSEDQKAHATHDEAFLKTPQHVGELIDTCLKQCGVKFRVAKKKPIAPPVQQQEPSEAKKEEPESEPVEQEKTEEQS